MPIWDYRPKADIWTGVAIGVGLLVAPVVIPMIAAAARPVVKAALKGGFLLYEKGREALAESMEVVEDLMEEVKSEVRAELTEAKE
jgi:hypothetical protein